jgi:hypothetical protein
MEVRNKREIKQSKRVIQQNRPSTAGVFHPTIMLNPMREHDVAQLGKRTELNSWAVCEIYFKKSEERKEKTSGFSSFPKWVVYLQCPPVRPWWRLFHGQAPVRLEPHPSW